MEGARIEPPKRPDASTSLTTTTTTRRPRKRPRKKISERPRARKKNRKNRRKKKKKQPFIPPPPPLGGPEGDNDGPFGYFSFSMGSPDEDFNVILGPGETDHGMDKLKEFEQVLQDNNQRI